jgi:hypothetical protein
MGNFMKKAEPKGVIPLAQQGELSQGLAVQPSRHTRHMRAL